jgi:molybdate transport system substrate-binding protein
MAVSSIKYDKLLVLAAFLLASCSRRPAASLTVAAAADLQFALEQVAVPFRAAHPGLDLRIVYGSSGNFYTQIRNRAPFDVFLSADIDYPRRLAAKPDDVFTYAIGRIILWVPPRSPLDPATALQDPRLRHLAIANPEHAPYGRAAESALHALGVYDAVKPKLVLGENIAQTFQFVQTGAADAGIVALSLALAPQIRGEGRYWEVPQSVYPALEQGGILLHDSPAARDFRDELLSPAGRRILSDYGFSVPEQPATRAAPPAFYLLTPDSCLLP